MDNNISSIDDLLTPEQAGERIGVKAGAMKLYRVQGTGPAYYTIGGKVFYSPADVAAYIQSRRKVA